MDPNTKLDEIPIIGFRPPDIVCRRTYILPVFLLSFFLLPFFRRPISEVAERNSTKIGHMVGSECNLKTHVRNLGYPLPLQIGGPKTTFWTTSQLKGKFNGLYLRNETWYRQSVKCVDNYEVSPALCQNVTNFGPQTASNSTCILPTLCKFCILLHCQASQMEISKRNSTTLCQTVIGRSNNVLQKSWGRPSRKKLGAKKLLHLFDFLTTSTLNGQ